MKFFLKQMLRSIGFDLVRYPHPGSIGFLLQRVFLHAGINCVLDIGARHGEYGLFLRHMTGYSGKIVSFEPVSENYAELIRRVSADDNWHCHQMALGSHPDILPINITKGTDFSSFLYPNEYASQRFGEHTQILHTEKVSVKRLDDIFDEVAVGIDPPRVFLKLDTQGWDQEVVRGATHSLAHVHALQFEASFKSVYKEAPLYKEMIQELTALNYEVCGFFPVSLDRSNLSVIEFDCVMIRRSSAEKK